MRGDSSAPRARPSRAPVGMTAGGRGEKDAKRACVPARFAPLFSPLRADIPRAARNLPAPRRPVGTGCVPSPTPPVIPSAARNLPVNRRPVCTRCAIPSGATRATLDWLRRVQRREACGDSGMRGDSSAPSARSSRSPVGMTGEDGGKGARSVRASPHASRHSLPPHYPSFRAQRGISPQPTPTIMEAFFTNL
jgi:hypothetical protein